MKKLLLFMFAVVAFAACEQAPIEEAQGVVMSDRSLEVSFEGADDTRIQLQGGKTVWTEGDHVSVFYRSTVNEEWQFMGKTGDRTGQIVPVDNSVNPPATHNRVVVIYPYNNEYYLNTETYSIEASLPTVQSYLKDSYGTNGNIMVSSGDYKQVSLKSVCGWLKLQLTGDGEVVKAITLRGNDGEQVAGELHINTSDATCVLASASGDAGDSEVGGTLVRPGTILTEVTLDCGEGVALGKEATAFYIALPPQTFEQGFTVEITCADDTKMVKSSNKALSIERNHIQPMTAMGFTPSVPNNQIWYTSSDGNIVEPYNTNAFGATIISNEYNNGMGVITFDGDVTTIGEGAFWYCDSLTSVNIPDSVTTIGEIAFYDCTSLTEFNGKFAEDNGRILVVDGVLTAFAPAGITEYNIPDSVTTIGWCAFAYCDSLTSVNIPDSVTTIVYYAFSACDSLTEFTGKFAEDNGRILVVDGVLTAFAPAGITEYNIPDSVTEIKHGAFWCCDSLTSVNIPDSVTTIGTQAFAYCDSLTSVTIPDSVTTIESHAFEDCTSLTSVYCKATTPPSLGYIDVFDNNGSGRKIYVPMRYVNKYMSASGWSEYASAIVGYDFENGVVVEMQPNNEIWYTSSDGNIVNPYSNNVFGAAIVSNTYTNGKGVITFDGDVTTIGNSAFYECTSLTSVNIPYSVTTIGESAFKGCTSLTEFKDKFASEDGRCLIIDGVLNYFAPGGLTEYTIPDSVTSIGEEAFAYCHSLTSVNIPDSITSIGGYAFELCTSLTSVNIPDSVITIGYDAFRDCTSLTSVTIGDSVTTIGEDAFYNCSSLTSVYCKATTPPALGSGYVFNYNGSGRKIYVPMWYVNKYKSASGWSEYASAIVGYDFEKDEIVEKQPYNEIWYTSYDGNVVTPYNTNAFGANTIANTYNNGMGVITFDGDVTSIGQEAFFGCESLTSVNIPNSVTMIGEKALAYCHSLTSVNIGDGVTTIGNEAFFCCESLTSVNIPDSVTEIKHGAFQECYNLTSVNIGDSVTRIGGYAFSFCPSLRSVTIPDSVTTIGEWVFADCSSLTSVTIPDNVTTIGEATFAACTSLTSITIPDSVTKIGEYAFAYCHSLTSVYISDISAWCNISFGGFDSNPLYNGCNLYLNNELVKDLTIPDSVTTIGDEAFYNCTSLTSVNIPDSVTSIGDEAFYGCSSLTGVNIPDSVTTIGYFAFSACYSLQEFNGKFASEDGRCLIMEGALFSFAPAGLTEYTIPDSVTSIGDSAFENCSSLTSITIPDSVTTIGWNAFAYCYDLTSVYCKATTPPVLGNTYVFDDNGSGRKIYVPMGSVEAYKSASYWKEYADDIEGYNF